MSIRELEICIYDKALNQIVVQVWGQVTTEVVNEVASEEHNQTRTHVYNQIIESMDE